MKGKIVTLAALVGLLAPPSVNAADIELTHKKYHKNPAVGCWYGNGWNELHYEVTITEKDVEEGKGENQRIITAIAKDFNDKLYKDRCGCSVDDTTAQIFKQNPDYDPSNKNFIRLREGDTLSYKTTQTRGRGMRCLL